MNIFCLLTVRITINFFLRTCSMSKCISSSWPLSCQTEALCKCVSLVACHSLVNQQVMFPLFCLTNVSRHEEVKWSCSSQEKVNVILWSKCFPMLLLSLVQVWAELCQMTSESSFLCLLLNELLSESFHSPILYLFQMISGEHWEEAD